MAIEVKAGRIGSGDLKGLMALREEGKFKRCIAVTLDPAPRQLEHVEVLPVAEFLSALWAGSIAS